MARFSEPSRKTTSLFHSMRLAMGVDHRGMEDKLPKICSGMTLMQIVHTPPFVIWVHKSVLWPSKYAKIRFRSGFCPGPRWGSSRRSPRPLVGWGGDIPPHISTHSVPTHLQRSPCVPRIPARSTPMRLAG